MAMGNGMQVNEGQFFWPASNLILQLSLCPSNTLTHVILFPLTTNRQLDSTINIRASVGWSVVRLVRHALVKIKVPCISMKIDVIQPKREKVKQYLMKSHHQALWAIPGDQPQLSDYKTLYLWK